MSRDHGSFPHDDGCCVSRCVHGISSCVTKHLTDAAKRRKGLLGLRVCRVSQSQRVRCGSHRRQACIVISSGYIVSAAVTLRLQWLQFISSGHIVSPVVTLYLQWSHCVFSDYIVFSVVTLCHQLPHCAPK